MTHFMRMRRISLARRFLLAALFLFGFSSGPRCAAQNGPTGQARVAPRRDSQQESTGAESAGQRNRVEEHYRAAVNAQLAEDSAAAEKEYREVISLAQPKLAAQSTTRTRAAGQQRFAAGERAALKEILGNAYNNVGVIYAQRNEYAQAALLFGEAAKWSAHIADLDRNWGTASFRAGEYQTAIAPLRRHARGNPQDGVAQQMLAVCYFMTEDFPKAAETFRPLLASLPDEPNLLYAAGVSMAKSGDAKTAEELLGRMAARNPDSAETHLFLGQAHAAQNEDAEALKEFARALEADSKLPQAHYSAGKIYLRQEKMEEAAREFRAELEVNPGDAPTEYRLGHVLLRQQKEGEAVEVLSDVVRQRPEDADARYELGKALLAKEDFAGATEQLERATQLRPDQPHLYYQLSVAYRRLGRTKEAVAAVRQYRKLQLEKFPDKNVPAGDEPK